MKIGSEPARDTERVAAARDAIGDAGLFVDANGAFSAKQALALAEHLAEHDVRWFEEPVSSDDVAGLTLMRARAPAGLDIAAGEYGYNLDYFRRLLALPSVEVLQADVSRCGGVTGFMQVAALCEAQHVDLSGHCDALHLHAACATAAAPPRMVPTTTCASSTCCSTGPRNPTTVRLRPIFRVQDLVSSSKNATQSAFASDKESWQIPTHRLGSASRH